MTAAENLNERVARIEGVYEHLATKADVEALRGWIIGAAAVLGVLTAAFTTIAAVVVQLTI